jgi:hypothetical protein
MSIPALCFSWENNEMKTHSCYVDDDGDDGMIKTQEPPKAVTDRRVKML